MFKHKWTAILKSEFNFPQPRGKISGSCTTTAAIGLPSDFDRTKLVRCRISVTVSVSGSETPLISAISTSEFSVIDNETNEDVIRSSAYDECTPIALDKTFQKIAQVTDTLCGQKIEFSAKDFNE